MIEGLLLMDDSGFATRITERFLTRGGVYKIIAVQDGSRMPINRFLGIDPLGILYIGKAISFIDRVTSLKKSISPNYNGKSHSCGRRYKDYPRIAEFFPFKIMYIEFLETDSPVSLEKQLLKEYMQVYGETPPLNAVV